MKTREQLQDRIAGALWGAAIGDAMGGPVEGKSWREIEADTGPVRSFLPYTASPWAFYAWKQEPGTITDDTRLRQLFAAAVFRDGSTLRRRTLKACILEAYEAAEPGFEKDWLEEYALSAQRDRLYVGGYPSNGGMISSLPAALAHAGRPEAAYRTAFEAIFIDQGYARDCSATHCSIAATALMSDAGLDTLICEGVYAVPPDLTASRMFGRPLEKQFEATRKIVETHTGFRAYREQFYNRLTKPETYDALETFAFAMGVILDSPDDPENAVFNAINLGRDNDSTATVVGGLMGCRYGMNAWRPDWIDTVRHANPELDLDTQAAHFAEIAAGNLAA